eukprot:TRINITY_DN10119_c0_g1_i1.p2 TRINITY_DN10119_c0_g1~~TRINITY_DN10119_c0_g1_i1.p2  ORF type:complete len:214 (-),score=22.52 TRINITY_DN10119_c0_g1_i1:216-857(-)
MRNAEDLQGKSSLNDEAMSLQSFDAGSTQNLLPDLNLRAQFNCCGMRVIDNGGFLGYIHIKPDVFVHQGCHLMSIRRSLDDEADTGELNEVSYADYDEFEDVSVFSSIVTYEGVNADEDNENEKHRHHSDKIRHVPLGLEVILLESDELQEDVSEQDHCEQSFDHQYSKLLDVSLRVRHNLGVGKVQKRERARERESEMERQREEVFNGCFII